MYKYERFRFKSEAVAKQDQLRTEGYDPKIYKGHREYVVQWYVEGSATGELVG